MGKVYIQFNKSYLPYVMYKRGSFTYIKVVEVTVVLFRHFKMINVVYIRFKFNNR